MKKSGVITVLLILSGISFGQTKTTDVFSKNNIGVLFNGGYATSNVQVYNVGVRGTRLLSHQFSIGAEFNYQTFIGTYGNADAMGAVGFAQFRPFRRGLFMELGAQGNIVESSSRTTSKKVLSPYGAIGYLARISKCISLQIQVRPFSFNGNRYELMNSLEKNYLLQKVYFGLNYTF